MTGDAERTFRQRLWGTALPLSSTPKARPPVVTASSIRWAEIAEEMEFTELSRLRKLAEQWRTGMLALTSLVALVGLVKGVGDASKLTHDRRVLVGVLMVVGFLLLLGGSVLSMRAAYGPIGRDEVVTGESLRWFEHQQAESVRLQLVWTQGLLLAAVLVLAFTSAVVYTADPIPATKVPGSAGSTSPS